MSTSSILNTLLGEVHNLTEATAALNHGTLFQVAAHGDEKMKIFAYCGLMVLSFYINAMCLMAELIVMTHSGVSEKFSEALELCCHIFIGPISAIAFISRDSFSTVLFFACLWHFFNDTNPFRPSNLIAWRIIFEEGISRDVKIVRGLQWGLSMCYFIHHFWIATAKLALNVQVLHLPATEPIAGVAVLAWLIGSGFTHMSLAMGNHEMSGAIAIRTTGIVMRVLADLVMLLVCKDHAQYVDWALLGGIDILWWISHLALLLLLHHFKKRLSKSEVKAESRRGKEEIQALGQALRSAKSVRLQDAELRPSDTSTVATDATERDSCLGSVCKALHGSPCLRAFLVIVWLLVAAGGFHLLHAFKPKLVAAVDPPTGSLAELAKQQHQSLFSDTQAVSLTVMVSSLDQTALVELPSAFLMPNQLPYAYNATGLTAAVESVASAVNHSAVEHLQGSCTYNVSSYWDLPVSAPPAPPGAPPCSDYPSWCITAEEECAPFAYCADPATRNATCASMPLVCRSTEVCERSGPFAHCLEPAVYEAAMVRWLLQPSLFNANATSTLLIVTVKECAGQPVTSDCVTKDAAHPNHCHPVAALSDALKAHAASSAFNQSGLLSAVATSAPDISAAVQHGTNQTLNVSMVSLPVGLILLALCVRNVRLLICTLLNIGVSGCAAVLVMTPIADALDVSVLALPMMAAVALALNIDYSLFLFSRFAEEIAKGEEPLAAVVNTLASSGYTVLVSGVTLCLSFLCMQMIPVATISTMGLAAAVTVFFAIAVALTLTPTLIFCCPRFFASTRYFGCSLDGFCCGCAAPARETAISESAGAPLTPRTSLASDENGSVHGKLGCWATCGKWVQGPVLAPIVVLLLVGLMMPFAAFGLPKLTYVEGFAPMLPRGADATDAYSSLQQNLGVGSVYPSSLLLVPPPDVVMHTDTAWLNASCQALKTLAKNVTSTLQSAGHTYDLKADELSGPMIARGACTVDAAHSAREVKMLCGLYCSCDPADNATCARDGANATTIAIQTTINPFSTQGQAWARAIRDSLPAAAVYDGVPVGTFYLLGKAPQMMDAADQTFDALPKMLGAILGLSVVVIGCAFHSVLIPVRAVLCIAWMLAIVFGASAIVYQAPGPLSWLSASVSPSDGTLFWMSPCIALPICIGLGLDYDIFFVETVVEHYDHGKTPKDAVVAALRQTGFIIAAAGAIMIVAFGALLLGPTPALNQTGFMLILGILCDCFLTTKVFIPALMACVCGEANFWPRAKTPRAKTVSSGVDPENVGASFNSVNTGGMHMGVQSVRSEDLSSAGGASVGARTEADGGGTATPERPPPRVSFGVASELKQRGSKGGDAAMLNSDL